MFEKKLASSSLEKPSVYKIMTSPTLKNEDPKLIKSNIKVDEIEELTYKTEKIDHEMSLMSLKIDNENLGKKYMNF